MSEFWPEDGGVFDGIFSADDPCPGERIRDKYGLIEFAAAAHLASSPRFAGLDMNGLTLLRLADPEEYRKVWDLARRRAEARKRSEKPILGSPDWLIVTDIVVQDPAQEQATLDQVGLTKAAILALVDG